MGSGYFPLHPTSELGKRLLEAAQLVDGVLDEIRDDVYSGDSGGGQFDNAASDGASMAMLALAAKLIRDGVRP